MSSELNNATRASWARAALEAFPGWAGQDRNGDLEFELDDVISDLICDLLHLSHEHGNLNPTNLLATAMTNYQFEVEEELENETSDP